MNNGSLNSARLTREERRRGCMAKKTNGLSEVKRDRGNEMKGHIRALGCSCAQARLYCEAHCLGPKQTWDLPTAFIPLCFVRADSLKAHLPHGRKGTVHPKIWYTCFSSSLYLSIKIVLVFSFSDVQKNVLNFLNTTIAISLRCSNTYFRNLDPVIGDNPQICYRQFYVGTIFSPFL